jgi:hypothetical protein
VGVGMARGRRTRCGPRPLAEDMQSRRSGAAMAWILGAARLAFAVTAILRPAQIAGGLPRALRPGGGDLPRGVPALEPDEPRRPSPPLDRGPRRGGRRRLVRGLVRAPPALVTPAGGRFAGL